VAMTLSTRWMLLGNPSHNLYTIPQSMKARVITALCDYTPLLHVSEKKISFGSCFLGEKNLGHITMRGNLVKEQKTERRERTKCV